MLVINHRETRETESQTPVSPCLRGEKTECSLLTTEKPEKQRVKLQYLRASVVKKQNAHY
jgi:hypothetical protein